MFSSSKSNISAESESEIWIVPFFGQGHLFPCMELCKQIASHNYKSTFIVSSNLSSSIPSSLRQYPLVEITEITSPPPPPPPPQQPPSTLHHRLMHKHNHMTQSLENLLSTRPVPPVCAIIDVMMGWTAPIFHKSQVPIVGFFTSGACSAAMEYALWLALPHPHLEEIKPGEIRLLPELPEDMALTLSDLKRRPHGHGPPGGRGGPPPVPGFPTPPPGLMKMGPPNPGEQPPWTEEFAGSIALMINTCDDLELPFINYLANQMGKPVWGVGPLLPEQFYKPAGSLLHDREIRTNNRPSNVTEDEVIQWLDSQPRGSVLYVSFGSEVGPTMEEYPQLADALEASTRPFIWVIQPGSGRSGPPRELSGSDEEGYFPVGLDSKVGKRGMIISGWAPQLLILSHPSTGGFLSHCGWNSTVEASGCGVPFLAWPIRGDQYYNAKLVINHLKVGHMISDDLSKSIKKDDIMNRIERLMGDGEMKKRAELLSTKFDHGFPATSVASLDAFSHFIKHKPAL